MEFAVIENVVDGREGFGPHFVEVWAAPSTAKKPGPVFATLFTGPITWAGERFRVEEFAKLISDRCTAINRQGNWEVSISYNTKTNRWVATCSHVNEDGSQGLTKEYVEWAM